LLLQAVLLLRITLLHRHRRNKRHIGITVDLISSRSKRLLAHLTQQTLSSLAIKKYMKRMSCRVDG